MVFGISDSFFHQDEVSAKSGQLQLHLDRGKAASKRRDEVLFIDARSHYRQVSRSLRDFLPEQIEFLANIVRLWRGEATEKAAGSGEMLKDTFPNSAYAHVAGLCKAATLAEIEAHGWSLNPGRYVGVGARAAEEFAFAERLEELNEELEALNREAAALGSLIATNVANVLASAT